MKIAVLIKQVPDTTDIKIDSKTGNLVREGVASIINPDDRLGLETALALKEAVGGEVVAVSMGPAQAMDALAEAYAMGADRCVLLCDRFFAGADTWATSYTLGKALEHLAREEPWDLVICGRQAIDGDTAQIGPQVAEHLGWPQVTYVARLKADQDGGLRAWRRLPGGDQEVACPLPALVTVLDAPNPSRRPKLDRLLAACQEGAPLTVLDAADIGCPARHTGLRGSLTQVKQTFSPKLERKTEWLEGGAEAQADALLGRLRENKLI